MTIRYGPDFNPRDDRPATDIILIHCSATPNARNVSARAIADYHMRPKAQGGRGWRSCGYHKIIERDGTIVDTLDENGIGAHSRGLNRRAAGVCLIGGVDSQGRPEASYTAAQWASLEAVVRAWKAKWPGAEVMGHRDAIRLGLTSDGPKACPCFDAMDWWASVAGPLPPVEEVDPQPDLLRPDQPFSLHVTSVTVEGDDMKVEATRGRGGVFLAHVEPVPDRADPDKED